MVYKWCAGGVSAVCGTYLRNFSDVDSVLLNMSGFSGGSFSFSASSFFSHSSGHSYGGHGHYRHRRRSHRGGCLGCVGVVAAVMVAIGGGFFGLLQFLG